MWGMVTAIVIEWYNYYNYILIIIVMYHRYILLYDGPYLYSNILLYVMVHIYDCHITISSLKQEHTTSNNLNLTI